MRGAAGALSRPIHLIPYKQVPPQITTDLKRNMVKKRKLSKRATGIVGSARGGLYDHTNPPIIF